MAAKTQTNRVRITPLTHTIESYRNARVTWSGCLAELLDNALSREKGNANRVSIEITGKEVRVFDDGVGIDDVSRIVRPGDSGTWNRSSDIGLYGVGATQALLWMGCRSEVHTVQGGQYARVYVDWDQLLRNRRSDAWHATVEHLGHIDLVDSKLIPAEMRELRRGTLLVAAKRPKGRRTPRTKEICNDLERVFTPALRAGRGVAYSGAGGKTHKLERLNPPTLADPVRVEGEVNGKTYRGSVGVLDHTDAKIAGIWFGYQHRMIVRKGAAHISGLPSNVYGYIELGDEWRRSLTTFKDDIARDLEPLIEGVRAQIQEVIEQGLDWNKDLKVDWLTSQLDAALFASPGPKPGRVLTTDADEGPDRGPGSTSSSSGGGRLSQSIDQGGQNPRDDPAQSKGITIEPDPGREPFVWAEIAESRIVISFDPDHPHFKKSLAEPLDCPAFFGAIGASFSSALAARSPEEAVRVFPSLRGKLTDDPKQRFATILDEFVRRTAQVRERPTTAQIEKEAQT